MSQRQQLERILEIDRRIRSKTYPNPNQIAKDLEVSRRVIFLDREFMINRLGAPISYDKQHKGWYYTDDSWILPNIMITEGELLAFLLSVEIARRYLGTALETSLRSAVNKISQTIQGSITVDLEILNSNYTFVAPSIAVVDDQILLGIHGAIRDRRKIWMRYYTASRDDHNERTISPYHLYNIRGDWFLIAYDDWRKDFRNFNIGRIDGWRVLDEHFTVDPDFSVTNWMQHAFLTERGGDVVDVVIRFDANQARYIRERRWHDTQQIEECVDGGLILSFRTAGINEVVRWVMQYGSHAEVLEPQSLREACKNNAVKMVELYCQS